LTRASGCCAEEVLQVLVRILTATALVALALTAPTTARAADPTSYNGPHLVFRTADGHVHVSTAPEAWYDFSDPNVDQDVTASAHTGSLAVGTPWGWATDTQEHVAYRSSNGHVNEFWRSLGTGAWIHTDLTTAAHASARAAGDVVGWDDNLRRVAYRAKDAHLHELTWSPTTKLWHDVDVTVKTRAKDKLSADPRYDPNTSVLTYHSTDGHVHTVVLQGTKLVDKDIWAAAHSTVKALGRPSAYRQNVVPPGAQGLHVLYRGRDGHIHDLWAPVAQTRTYNYDLTKLTKGKAQTTGDPIGWSYTYDYFTSYLEVRYVGADSFMYGMDRGTGSNDPDRGPVHPTPWFGGGPDDIHAVRSITQLTFWEPDANHFGFAAVLRGGHVALWFESPDDTYDFPMDVTAMTHAAPAVGGATGYYTETSG
jgi:hypothetical protein